MKVNVYLDDWRIAPKGWIQAWNNEELIQIFENPEYQVNRLSLDHDLGEDANGDLLETGYDFVKTFVEKGYVCRAIHFHTANPIGKENMISYLENAKKHGAIPQSVGIVKLGFPKSTENKGNVFNDTF